jgi:lysozyme family protein
MANFDLAIPYVLENEGGFSNDPNDSGGATSYGITDAEAQRHGYDVRRLTLDQAKSIYRSDYWSFDDLTDQRVATKVLDIVVNMGVSGGMKVIQRACGVPPDGVWGPITEASLNTMDAEYAIEQMSMNQSDHYVDICTSRRSQMDFLKGWERRAIRRPR